MSLPAGTRLGPYEIVAPLGAGGMGEVYLAKDPRLDREVAIKVLPEHLAANPAALKRFEREAKAVAALSHPNILDIHDFSAEGKISYAVTEFLQGETLRARIRRSDIPAERIVEIALAVTEGLAAAHSRSVIHRDLKPENVFLTSEGRVKILDFGLAYHQPEIAEIESTSVATQSRITEAGVVIGTVPYMSPEQVRGESVDARSDIFSFGCVLYEMVTRQRAFPGNSSSDIIPAILNRDPPQPVESEAGFSPALLAVAMRCLRKDPDRRFQTARELTLALRNLQSEITGSSPRLGEHFVRQFRKPVVTVSTIIVLLILAFAVFWFLDRQAKVRRAKEEALPQIMDLIGTENYSTAFALARKTKAHIPNDPDLNKLWDEMSRVVTAHTNPEGANIYIQEYSSLNDPWEYIGTSPLIEVRIPFGLHRWKIEKTGYEPVHATISLRRFPPQMPAIHFALDKQGSLPAGMVRVPGGETELLIPGLDHLPPVLLKDYFIDRYEVTNRQFKEFMKAGGYQKRDYWKAKFIKDGRELSWEEAMLEFRDSTGRPGPATWEAGEYPKGQDELPVNGVSWYEATAYAEFIQKSLPSIYHWNRAAYTWLDIALIIPMSNFGSNGLLPVGSKAGMSQYGTYDMAGNVKEWCWNESGERRAILGGAWSEPTYMSAEFDAQPPFTRLSTYGFRCVKYLESVSRAASEAIDWAIRDYQKEKPVPDEIFQIYKTMYSYDKTELHPAIESVADSAEHWKVEKVTFDAAYGNERVIAYLFLPKSALPPYHTVIYFTGSNAIWLPSSGIATRYPAMLYLDFILQSGRAVLFPVYKGTFERGDSLKSDYPAATSHYRDHVVQWSKDLGRSIDYLETRKDVDPNKLAFCGLSWGASMGMILPALEPRLKANILVSGGLYLQNTLPEVDIINFISRVTTPTLMLNGRYDLFYPVESSQVPAFQLLGTPEKDKRRVVYEVGHIIPRRELIRETLNWLDRYLGPVQGR